MDSGVMCSTTGSSIDHTLVQSGSVQVDKKDSSDLGGCGFNSSIKSKGSCPAHRTWTLSKKDAFVSDSVLDSAIVLTGSDGCRFQLCVVFNLVLFSTCVVFNLVLFSNPRPDEVDTKYVSFLFRTPTQNVSYPCNI